MKDYYKILGVDKNASEEEIKKAFRRLAHQHHPDRGGDEKKFKEINEAYQVLSNKERREQYDRFGTTFEAPGAGPWWGQGSPFNRGFDFSEFFRRGQNGGGFDFDLNDIFDSFFGAGTRTQRRKKGADIRVDLEISLEEAFSGLAKKVELKKFIICPRCAGAGAEPGSPSKQCLDCSGKGEIRRIRKSFLGSISEVVICPACGGAGIRPEKLCRDCKGEGRRSDLKEIKIEIPAGIQNGQLIKIAGEGEAAEKGGLAGDFYAHIHIKPHRLFRREKNDLYCELPVSFSQAALGDKIEARTIDGAIDLKIPSGTESGAVLKVRDKGMKRMGQAGRGDFYIQIKVKTPKSLNREQKELLEKLKKEGL
jgi:molecular chaperone DnaJ